MMRLMFPFLSSEELRSKYFYSVILYYFKRKPQPVLLCYEKMDNLQKNWYHAHMFFVIHKD